MISIQITFILNGTKPLFGQQASWIASMNGKYEGAIDNSPDVTF